MASRWRAHDEAHLAVFLPPHEAIRLPSHLTTEHVRVDVVPNNMVADLVEPGMALVVDVGAVFDISNIKLRDVYNRQRDDDDFYRRFTRDLY